MTISNRALNSQPEFGQMCTRCVLDETDPGITFDAEGVCKYCYRFDEVISKRWHPDDEGRRMLEQQLHLIREGGRGRDFDCILGLSGGVDSSYLALKLADYDIRALAVHVDAGWNSELATYNIEQIVKKCGFELHTEVLNWLEVRDLQVAYLKAGVPNQDVVQDHGFFATLYHTAMEANIRFVMNGGNIATESVFPDSWQHAAMDEINLKAIHARFGDRELRSFRTISFWHYYFYYPYVKRMQVFRPLNFMPYSKDGAVVELQERLGYKEYGRKHGESVWTKFFQNYILPTKFGWDKRKPHLSSLILSGQMTRPVALAELARPLYEPVELERDRNYVATKLELSVDELEGYIRAEGSPHDAYPTWNRRYNSLKSVQGLAGRVLGRRSSRYS